MPVTHRSPIRVVSMTALLVVAAWGHPGAAAPPTRDACITAHEQAQELRRQGQLRAAQQKLVFCSQDQCPGLIKSDCGQWLGEVAESMPTVVLEATDAAGNDVVAVRVLFDGRELTKKLDGKALPVDPGQHTFRFEGAGGQQVEKNEVIHQGEKNRVLTVRFPGSGEATPAETPAPVPATGTPPGPESSGAPPPRDSGKGGGSKVGAFVLGGFGLAAIGVFAYLGATTSSDVSDMRSSCAPDCDQSRVDADKKKALFADVALGVGVVSLGVATVLLLTGHPSKPAAAAALPLDVRASPKGAMATVGASF